MKCLHDTWVTVLNFADKHGSGLAALAALVGIPVLLYQIFQTARQEKARARARRVAALSALPMTLSGINAWANEVTSALVEIRPWATGARRDEPMPTFRPPATPSHLIGAIENMIEADPKGSVGLTLAAIVSDVQVLSSRISDGSWFRADQVRRNVGAVSDNIIKAATIYARAESLYAASRKISEDAPVDYARVEGALNIMGIRESQFSDVHNLLAHRYERDQRRRNVYERLRDWTKRSWRSLSDR